MNFSSIHQVIVQGINQPLGKHYSLQMRAYGTKIVAGVSAGCGGQTLDNIPIFDLVEQALIEVGNIDTSLIFVPPLAAKDAVIEAIAAGIKQIILVTRGIPPLDLVTLLRKAQATNTLLLGPSSAGIIIPEQILLGTMEPQFYSPGKVGLISRSPSLSHEVALELTQAGIGQSIAVNLGDEDMIASSFEYWLHLLEEDSATEIIVLIGQNYGHQEELAARYIKVGMSKPVVAYIAGHRFCFNYAGDEPSAAFSPQISRRASSADILEQKLAAFKKAKISLAQNPSQICELVKQFLPQPKSKYLTHSLNGKT